MVKTYTLKEMRGAYKARNSWWGYFVVHPIASVGVWIVANFTRFRPEVICVFSFLVGLIALPFFYHGDTYSLYVGAWIVFVSNVLDAMDGKLARLTGQVTSFGGYLDTLFDVLKHSLFIIALVIGQYHLTEDVTTLYWGLAVTFFMLFNYANENLLGRTRAFLPYRASGNGSKGKKGSILRRIRQYFADRSLLPIPCGVELLTLMFIVGPFIDQVMPCLIIGGIGFVLYSTAYTISALKQTRWLTTGIEKDYLKRSQLKDIT